MKKGAAEAAPSCGVELIAALDWISCPLHASSHL